MITPDLSKKPTILDMNPAQYPGGIAIWGALEPVFDTSSCPWDSGVHIHARMMVGGPKCIDETFDVVRVELNPNSSERRTFVVNGDDAATYNIAAILKCRMTFLACPDCQSIHSDRGYDAVHLHREHTCEACGAAFSSDEPSISNPVMLLKEMCGDVLQDRIVIDPVERRIRNVLSRFSGGIQLWGSNPAIIWTSPKPEEGGIHFHGFLKPNILPEVDETYGSVSLDGMVLDPDMMRHLMAQRALPYLVPHLSSLRCENCGGDHFDNYGDAVTPHEQHHCEHCGATFTTPGGLSVVSNPIIELIRQLYTNNATLNR